MARTLCLDLRPTSVLSLGPVRGELCEIGGGGKGVEVCVWRGEWVKGVGCVWRGPAGRTTVMVRTPVPGSLSDLSSELGVALI